MPRYFNIMLTVFLYKVSDIQLTLHILKWKIVLSESYIIPLIGFAVFILSLVLLSSLDKFFS